MSCFDCLKKCKMTSQIKSSKHCNEQAEITESGIVFGCNKSMENTSQSEKNFLTCMFYDLEMYNKCVTCPLECPKNENPKMAEFVKKRKKVDKILGSINNFGLTTGKTINIAKIHKENNSISEDALNALSLSNNLLAKGMSGKGYDVVHYKYLVKSFIKKLKK